jgi:hypothetical protein
MYMRVLMVAFVSTDGLHSLTVPLLIQVQLLMALLQLARWAAAKVARQWYRSIDRSLWLH